MGKFHDILGVPVDADKKAIKKAFHTLSKKYHPDLNPGDAEIEEKFKNISAAYTGLMDGDDGDDPHEKARRYAEKHFRNSGFDAQMRGIFGDGYVFTQHHQAGMTASNVRVQYAVPVRKWFTGGEFVFEAMIPTVTAHGFGYVPRKKTIKLEPQTPIGTQLVYDNEGSTGEDGTTGKLIIEVVPTQDGIYDCDGLNLVVRGKIDSTDAIVGKKKRFKLPNDEVQEFDVPVGVQNNQAVTIRGKGLKHVSGRVGNLIIVFDLRTPNFTDEQRQKIADLLDSFNNENQPENSSN